MADKDPIVLRYIGNVDGLGYYQPGVPTDDLRESQVQEFAEARFSGDYEDAYDWLAKSPGWEPVKRTAAQRASAAADEESDLEPAGTVADRAARRRGR